MKPRTTSIPTICYHCDEMTLRRWYNGHNDNLWVECLGCGNKHIVNTIKLWNALKNISD